MSYLEDLFELHLKSTNSIDYEREYIFHPTRKWRLDFALPDLMIAVEIEGGTWLKGARKSRHTTGAGFAKDCEKYNEAAILGWAVLRVTSDQVKSGQALQWLERLIEAS